MSDSEQATYVEESINRIRAHSKLRVNDQLALLVDIATDKLRLASAKLPETPEVFLRLEIDFRERYLFELKGSIRGIEDNPKTKVMKEADVVLNDPPREYVQFLENHDIK